MIIKLTLPKEQVNQLTWKDAERQVTAFNAGTVLPSEKPEEFLYSTNITDTDAAVNIVYAFLLARKNCYGEAPKVEIVEERVEVKCEEKHEEAEPPKHVEEEPTTDDDEVALFKKALDKAGVKYHHKAGLAKLKELYESIK